MSRMCGSIGPVTGLIYHLGKYRSIPVVLAGEKEKFFVFFKLANLF